MDKVKWHRIVMEGHEDKNPKTVYKRDKVYEHTLPIQRRWFKKRLRMLERMFLKCRNG